jgi:hypothetical protein
MGESRLCTRWGVPADQEDAFCGSCGSQIKAVDPEGIAVLSFKAESVPGGGEDAIGLGVNVGDPVGATVEVEGFEDALGANSTLEVGVEPGFVTLDVCYDECPELDHYLLMTVLQARDACARLANAAMRLGAPPPYEGQRNPFLRVAWAPADEENPTRLVVDWTDQFLDQDALDSWDAGGDRPDSADCGTLYLEGDISDPDSTVAIFERVLATATDLAWSDTLSSDELRAGLSPFGPLNIDYSNAEQESGAPPEGSPAHANPTPPTAPGTTGPRVTPGDIAAVKNFRPVGAGRSRWGKKPLWGVALLVVVFAALVVWTNQSNKPQGPTAIQVCMEFQNFIWDAQRGVYTDAEMRTALQSIRSKADQVQYSGTMMSIALGGMLAATNGGFDQAEVESALSTMNTECEAAGMPLIG